MCVILQVCLMQAQFAYAALTPTLRELTPVRVSISDNDDLLTRSLRALTPTYATACFRLRRP